MLVLIVGMYMPVHMSQNVEGLHTHNVLEKRKLSFF